MQIFYATRDGQSRRIAERLAARFADLGVPSARTDLATARLGPADWNAAEPIIVVAAVRYGKHLPEAEAFLAAYGKSVARPPLVLFSVNLTARKPGKDTAEGNVYLRKVIERHGLKPILTAAIAGRLDYARYRWFDRQMIRFIMMLTGGPTDPTTSIEYTQWDVVDHLAQRVVERSA